MHSSLQQEVERFRIWASDYPMNVRSGEWECKYEEWPCLHDAVLDYLDSQSPHDTDIQSLSDIIYAVARDNEIVYLVSELAKRPAWFAHILPHVLVCDEPDAQWQFAVALGKNVLPYAETEIALLSLVEASDEYVSRMALQALGKIESKYTEYLCERAWSTTHEYQRIMTLWVLKEIGSPNLKYYLARAKEDGRLYVVSNAVEIEHASNVAPAAHWLRLDQ